MSPVNYYIILRMLVAHFLSDFVFQRTYLTEKKDQPGMTSFYFWLHIVLNFVILYVILWDWSLWPVAAWITLIHFVIDAVISKISNSGLSVFLVDQSLHIITIFAVWLIYSNQLDLFYQDIYKLISVQRYWGLFLAYLLLSVPSSILVRKITQTWSDKIKQETDNGLENAGKWIGLIERYLIFTFITLNHIEAVGFLLAAKSVFRFGELRDSKEEKKTEYIIIGTLLSFSIAVTVGLVYQIAK